MKTGELPGLATLRRSIPPGLREIMSVQNIGPKRVRALYEALGVRDLKSLRMALANHENDDASMPRLSHDNSD